MAKFVTESNIFYNAQRQGTKFLSPDTIIELGLRYIRGNRPHDSTDLMNSTGSAGCAGCLCWIAIFV
jgi:hypothetical protein